MATELRLAQALGSHAVAVYLAALVLLLLGVAVAWRVARRRTSPHAPPASAPARRRLRLAAAALAGAGVVFAAMALLALGTDAPVGRFDTALALALRGGLPASVLRPFAQLTHLGDALVLTAVCVAVAALLLARGHRTLAFVWVVAVAGNGTLTRLLKRGFERARPPHDHGFAVADGWSFPSGHSSGAVATYGMLAYLGLRLLAPRWQLPVLLLAAATVLTTGISRVLLQVHYASDVLAGFATGLFWLTLCVVAAERLRGRGNRAAGVAA